MMDRLLQPTNFSRWTWALCVALALAGCSQAPSPSSTADETASASSEIDSAQARETASLRYPADATNRPYKLQPVVFEFPPPPLPSAPNAPRSADAPYKPRMLPAPPEVVETEEDLAAVLQTLPAPPPAMEDVETDAGQSLGGLMRLPATADDVETVDQLAALEQKEVLSHNWPPVGEPCEGESASLWGATETGEHDLQWRSEEAEHGDVRGDSRWEIVEPVAESAAEPISPWELVKPHDSSEGSATAGDFNRWGDVVDLGGKRRLPVVVESEIDPAEEASPAVDIQTPQAAPISRIPVPLETANEEVARAEQVAAQPPLAPELTLPEALAEDDHEAEHAAPQPTLAPQVELNMEAFARAAQDDAMRAVRVRTELLTRHAFSLGQRGAKYSARVELIEALRMIAQALDAKAGGRQHSDALARGFRALEEADDFVPRGTALEANLDMSVLAGGHKTPVLKDSDLSNITPLTALQRYYTFAQEQLIIAGGGERGASAALFGLGQLETLMHKQSVGGLTRGAPKSMVFHQAAMMVDPANYKAANELGVLLARYGQYEQAREVLVHSVRVAPRPESWNNLAIVHGHLGQHELARRATYESQLAARNQPSSGDYADAFVRWVEPEQFASSSDVMDEAIPAPDQPEPSTTTAEPVSRRSGSGGLMRLIPWVRSN